MGSLHQEVRNLVGILLDLKPFAASAEKTFSMRLAPTVSDVVVKERWNQDSADRHNMEVKHSAEVREFGLRFQVPSDVWTEGSFPRAEVLRLVVDDMVKFSDFIVSAVKEEALNVSEMALILGEVVTRDLYLDARDQMLSGDMDGGSRRARALGAIVAAADEIGAGVGVDAAYANAVNTHKQLVRSVTGGYADEYLVAEQLGLLPRSGSRPLLASAAANEEAESSLRAYWEAAIKLVHDIDANPAADRAIRPTVHQTMAETLLQVRAKRAEHRREAIVGRPSVDDAIESVLDRAAQALNEFAPGALPRAAAKLDAGLTPN